MSDLRIFSYLPNPRIWKATIAARLCGVAVEVRGGSPLELPKWLWDFDARPLSDEELQGQRGTEREAKTGFSGRLYKTDAFMEAHPFGTVPAAFSPDGSVGIFESNSIMRAVARLGEKKFPLYATDAYGAARVDSFLDASLVFARDGQRYLLSLGSGSLAREVHASAAEAFATYLGGIELALTPDRAFLVGEGLTLADICFVAELSLFSRERTRASMLVAAGLASIVGDDLASRYPRAAAHYRNLCEHEAFVPDVRPYLDKLQRDIEKDRAASDGS